MEKEILVYPEPIRIERVSYLISQKGIYPIIANIDLEMIKMKLREPEEGENWTHEQCDSAEIEYKRYLHMCKVYGKGIVPNKIMDTFWHYHILDTIAYHKDCDTVFGHYLHHFPYFGMRGEQDAIHLKNSFLQTKQRYREVFGEDMARNTDEMNCWHDCENRCWHACSNDK
ncbi:MAG: glycine-rich domain-containing protein [Flavobacteriales bacterium]